MGQAHRREGAPELESGGLESPRVTFPLGMCPHLWQEIRLDLCVLKLRCKSVPTIYSKHLKVS